MDEIVVVGAGPAGLMAAEVLATHGLRVSLYERMPSVGRKLLMAGRGGLNITHSEPEAQFLQRYGSAEHWLKPHIDSFNYQALLSWVRGLGQDIFVGSSGRVFPVAMKASPLLRAWLRRLQTLGVTIHTGHSWAGWRESGELVFTTPDGDATEVSASAVVLCLGGGSWAKLGSDGAWVPLIRARGISVGDFKPSNCGLHVSWSSMFREKFAGAPLKGCSYAFAGQSSRGEAVVTAYGLEGGGIYALSAAIRDRLDVEDQASLDVDLRPEMALDEVARKLRRARGGESLSNFLRKSLQLSPVQISLMREAFGKDLSNDPLKLARCVKQVPVTIVGVQGLNRAISSAGGVKLDEIDENLMLKKAPGVHVAGEMIDWEAPTGGYLLHACLATGRSAGLGVLKSRGLSANPR